MKNVIHILIGQALLSRIAGSAELLALNWWVYDATSSSAMVGVVTLARLVPLVIAAPHIGTMADRYEPVRVLASILGIGAVMTFVCSGIMCIGQGIQEDSLISTIWVLIALLVLRAMVTSAEPAVRSTVLMRLSEEDSLLKSMSSMSLVLTTALIIGPLFAGVFMNFGGATVVIFMCGLLYAFAAVLTLRIPKQGVLVREDNSCKKKGSPWGIAFREVNKNPILGAQIILALGPMFCIFPYTALLPVLAREIFIEDAQNGIAFLSFCSGVGAVIGALCLRFIFSDKPSVFAVIAAASLCLPFLALAFSRHLPVVVGLVSVGSIGLLGQVYRTSNRTATLLFAPPDKRGLFSGISQTDRVLIPAGAFVFGVIADQAGTFVMLLTIALANTILISPALVIMMKHAKT